jgi:hypothetical protein
MHGTLASVKLFDEYSPLAKFASSWAHLFQDTNANFFTLTSIQY